MTAEYGRPADIDKWMQLVQDVRFNFPGLETDEGLAEHRETVLEFMGRNEAVCVKDGGNIMGVLLFSKKHNMICCLAVSPEYRRRGAASVLMDKALSELDRNRDITVTTFREGDEKGDAPRALYKKYGFEEGELVTEFGYPNQVFILHKSVYTLAELQPSQFYISDEKLRSVESWFDPADLSSFEPIPIKLLDGNIIMTDGHTRAVAALRSGLDTVPLIWDTDDLDWDMYRRCVEECRNRGVCSPEDLLSRIITEEEYAEKWDRWCDEMQADVLRKRKQMDEIRLVRPSAEDAEQIEEYRAEFPSERMRVTYDPERIPGMDYLEDYSTVSEWLEFCESMKDRISWFMSVRNSDDRIVGFCCLRHKLEYDDDDPDFASHIGYSIRPSERRKGYAKEQLRLVLHEAHEMGIDTARIICRDINEGSNRTIIANGGVYVDSIYGDESGMTVNRYDIITE